MGMLRFVSSRAGKKPSPRLRSVVGQAQTVGWLACMRSRSAGVRWVAWTRVVLGLRRLRSAKSSMGLRLYSAWDSVSSTRCSQA